MIMRELKPFAPLGMIGSSGPLQQREMISQLVAGSQRVDSAQMTSCPRNLVIFIGFQAPGTRGAIIKGRAPEVKIFGDFVPIRAQVAALEQFSDHADPPELLEWLRTFANKPGVTYLVHGEPSASSQLRDLMKKELGWNVQLAEYRERVEVK